ncbi:hypothetical protein N9865_01890 [Paraglaciecola sp.]|nr:hypothetical protein [Paraglaciecola sp.]
MTMRVALCLLPSLNAFASNSAANVFPSGASTHGSNSLMHVLIQNQPI